MRIALILVLLLLVANARAQSIVGVVDALSGAASIDNAPLHLGGSVYEGAEVRTDPDSRLRLRLSDGTSFTLGPASAFRFKHLARAGDSRPTLVHHLLGFLRATVAPQTAADRVQVETDSDVAAVRGTEWIQRTEPNATELFVAAGHVAVRGTGGAVVLAPGEGVTFHARAAHTPVTHWPPAKVATFDAATSLP